MSRRHARSLVAVTLSAVALATACETAEAPRPRGTAAPAVVAPDPTVRPASVATEAPPSIPRPSSTLRPIATAAPTTSPGPVAPSPGAPPKNALRPGTYASGPFVVPFEFTVPQGWRKEPTRPRPNERPADRITIRSATTPGTEVVVVSGLRSVRARDGRCPDPLRYGAPAPARTLVDDLRVRGLRADDVRPVRYGDLEGFEIFLRPSLDSRCPDHPSPGIIGALGAGIPLRAPVPQVSRDASLYAPSAALFDDGQGAVVAVLVRGVDEMQRAIATRVAHSIRFTLPTTGPRPPGTHRAKAGDLSVGYTVGDGWSLEPAASEIVLQLDGRYPGQERATIRVTTKLKLPLLRDGCPVEGGTISNGQEPNDWRRYVRAYQGIDARIRPTSLGSSKGWVVTPRRNKAPTCHLGVMAVGGDVPLTDGRPALRLTAPVRWWVVSVGDRTVVVEVGARDDASFREAIDVAESLRFS